VLSGGTDSLSVDTWYHVALVRKSDNTTVFYRDGVSKATGTVSGTINNTNGLLFGRYPSGVDYLNGYIDDVRVTQGLARYTSTFTPPTTAYLTSAGDVNKQILINETADGVAIGTGGINQARIAKAWVEFDGSGITINASYNVSSITDHGNRDYTINFSTAMTDAYYSIVGSNIGQTSSYNWSVVTGMGTAKTASAARINVPHINDSSLYANDANTVNVIVFGN
jgi:hypothetical protein